MPKFAYVIQDGTGKMFKGSISAPSRDRAAIALQEKGYMILELKDTSSAGALTRREGSRSARKVPAHVLAFFAEQMSTLIAGGVPLVRAITLLGEYSSSPELRSVLMQVAKDISTGVSLHNSLAKHPKAFNHVWLSLVQAGEVGGKLPETLMQISSYIKKETAIKSKIITAVTYPAILLIMSLFVLVYFVIGIVPTFAKIFEDFQMDLPAITEGVLWVSNTIRSAFFYMLAALIAAIVAFRAYVKTPPGKRAFHNFLLNVPLLGNFLKNVYYERLLSTLATLLQSGVTILNAITVLEESFDSNVVIQQALRKAKKEVSEGHSIADSFRDTHAFPGIMTEMMRIGEESGRLPNIITTLSKFYNDHIEQFIARFSSVIDPILIIGVGLIIGVVVLSIFMPIFKMSQLGAS